MSYTPAVSVIMPIYNAAPFLEESLGGLLQQTLQNMEIICVNDGSTDNSPEIVRAYASADARIRIIDKPNGGYGSAMNAGLAAATGEYIGILEPDDFAEVTMFERLYETAVQNHADLVKSNYWAYKTSDHSNTFVEPLWEKQYNIVTSAEVDPKIVIGPACIWSAIYKKALIENNGIRFTETPGASYQDTAFAFKVLACAKRVVFLKDAFLHYRTDNENSSVNSKGKVFSICDEFQSIQDFLNESSSRRSRFSRVLQVHKLRVYGWNLRRLAPEYKDLFRTQVALDFIRAEYDGFLHSEDFSAKEWQQLQDHIDFYYNSPAKRELTSLKHSLSYRVGRVLTFVPRKVRDTISGRKRS